MRISTITATILSIVSLANAASAADDFSALLADLSFGEAPSLTVAKTDTAESLQPVPTGMVMPEMVESAPQEPTVAESLAPPKVALKDPVPATSPAKTDQIDLEAAFATQDLQSAVPAQTVAHLFGMGDESCDECITCTPRERVQLPSSTFLQYFRSNACYVHVWDGYQRHCPKSMSHLRGECDCFDKKNKFGFPSCSSGSCNNSGCTSCDTGCAK